MSTPASRMCHVSGYSLAAPHFIHFSLQSGPVGLQHAEQFRSSNDLRVRQDSVTRLTPLMQLDSALADVSVQILNPFIEFPHSQPKAQQLSLFHRTGRSLCGSVADPRPPGSEVMLDPLEETHADSTHRAQVQLGLPSPQQSGPQQAV